VIKYIKKQSKHNPTTNPLFAVLSVAIIIIAIVAVFNMLQPDLSQPISANDTLTFASYDGDSSAGDPLLGYPAPLENFLPIYEFRKRDDEPIFNWFDESSPRAYWLPLYDDDGLLRRTFFFTRVSEDTFYSADPQPELISSRFSVRMRAERAITAECNPRGIVINSFRHLSHPGGNMVLADTSEGTMGMLLDPTTGGMLLFPFFSPPDYGFFENADRVLNEQELRDILSR